MPLISCPDCGKEISDQAVICIGCGRPMKPAATPSEESLLRQNGRSDAKPEPRAAAVSPPDVRPIARKRRWPLWLAAALAGVAAAALCWWRLSPGKVAESSTIGYRLVRIPPGRFQMGSPSDEPQRSEGETRHWVTISKGFLLGATTVTQGQWQKVMGNNPSFFKNCGDDCPVESVSWFDVVDFCNRLSDLEGLSHCYGGVGEAIQWDRTCAGYRLPTEAEWEYAARAGSDAALSTGPLTIRGENSGPELDPIAWYGGNSAVAYAGAIDCSAWKGKQYPSTSCGPHPVAGKRGNAWGLFDMLGNVWEWVWDFKGEYPAGSVTDPTGPAAGALRVDRGGCWECYASFCRSAYRDGTVPGSRYYSLGFRLARSLPDPATIQKLDGL